MKLVFLLLMLLPAISKASFGMVGAMQAVGGACYEYNSSWAPAWGNIVGLWHMNTDWNASVGPNMSASGAGATFATGKVGGNTGNFDGASYAATAAASTYAFANTTFTVAFWVKTNSAAFIVANGATGMGWGLSNAYIFLKNCANHQLSYNYGKDLADGKWHHVVAVITTNTTTENLNAATVYIDGVLVNGSMSYPGDGAYCDPTNVMGLSVGARAVPALPSLYLTGQVDEVAIWNTALTAAQAKLIYDQQSCGTN